MAETQAQACRCVSCVDREDNVNDSRLLNNWGSSSASANERRICGRMVTWAIDIKREA